MQGFDFGSRNYVLDGTDSAQSALTGKSAPTEQPTWRDLVPYPRLQPLKKQDVKAASNCLSKRRSF